jgi:hypothetical protein
MPRQKKSANASKPTQSKAEFVRAQPASVGAKDVVKAAKAAGIPISEAYVYTIRYEQKRREQKGKPGRPAGRRGRGRAPAAAAAPARTGGVEDLLRAAAAEIGLSRAIALLQEQQRAVRAVLGG